MKREILKLKLGCMIGGCCPGHDVWPTETYKNRRSEKARSRDKGREHRYVRRVMKQRLWDGDCERF